MKNLSERELEEIANFVRINEIANVAEMLLFILGFKSNLAGTKYIVEGLVQKYGKSEMSCNESYCK